MQAEARLLPEARCTARKALDLIASSRSNSKAPRQDLAAVQSHRISRPTWDDDSGTMRATDDIGEQDDSAAPAAESANVDTSAPDTHTSSARKHTSTVEETTSSTRTSLAAPPPSQMTPDSIEAANLEGLVWGLLSIILSAEKQTDLALQSVLQGLSVAQPQHIGLLLKIEARTQVASGECAGT